MNKPTAEQKIALREHLDKTKPDQWVAMMQWILLQVACEQDFFISLLFDEADRRTARDREIGVNPRHQIAHFLDVMKDLKLKVVPEGLRA